MRIQCGDTVAVDYARFGWSGKTFEVVDWRLAVEDDAGAPLMGVDVTLRESDSGVHYIQFKVQVTDATAPSIISMIVLLDAEVHVHDYEDVNTATETASWFQSVATGHIRIGARDDSISAITKAQVTAIQNVGAGWSWELINKSSTVYRRPGRRPETALPLDHGR